MQVQSLGQDDPLEQGMAIHSSILAWRIPGTEKPGGLQSIQFQRVARKDKKAFLSDQCKEKEENNRMEKTRGLFMKITDTKGKVMHRWAQ